MLVLLISCFSFIIVSKSLWMRKGRSLLLSAWFWEGILSRFMVSWLKKGNSKKKNVEMSMSMSKSLLDLPELALDCILDRLPPAGLCSMAGVNSCFRERCSSDHLWEKHMKQKWGQLIGPAAYREWQCHIIANSSTNRQKLGSSKQKGFLGFSWFTQNHQKQKQRKPDFLPLHSIMSFYLSLETGKFWFPAQVFNRENGHAGFVLSCYDARVCYDSKTDTFQARYSPHGRRTTEENISWNRLRVPPIDTPSYHLHNSDSLFDLKPGDYIEIQWRRNKEFPYGWWYGVIGHMESCNGNGNQNHCHCQYTDTVMLEFKQYPASSRWRKTTINRKDHREVGNEVDGFYGGLRKLYKEEEISMWKSLWPKQVLE